MNHRSWRQLKNDGGAAWIAYTLSISDFTDLFINVDACAAGLTGFYQY